MQKANKNNFKMLLIVLLFSALMMASVIRLPWGNELHEIPTTNVGSELFRNFWVLLIILGLGLAAAILGGVYLAKMEAMVEEDEK